MASSTSQGAALLNGLIKGNRFSQGLGAKLPPAYLKFYNELQATPTAVHYIPREGQFHRDEVTGIVTPVQNIPIPVIYPKEHNEGIWGGEGVVKGYQKRHQLKRRVPHYWVPVLRRNVVYSSVLNEYMALVVTDRTMDLIHESRGFDHYLLKTPACDLKSFLALKIKRYMLAELKDGCPQYSRDEKKQAEILHEYGAYAEQYTDEEIEWYGHTYEEAIKKLCQIIRDAETIQPQKYEFRSQLIEQLRNAGIAEAQPLSPEIKESTDNGPNVQESTSSSWLSKMNPFGKKPET